MAASVTRITVISRLAEPRVTLRYLQGKNFTYWILTTSLLNLLTRKLQKHPMFPVAPAKEQYYLQLFRLHCIYTEPTVSSRNLVKIFLVFLNLIFLKNMLINGHCVKSVQIRNFFWSVFSCIRTEYGDLLHKLHSV